MLPSRLNTGVRLSLLLVAVMLLIACSGDDNESDADNQAEEQAVVEQSPLPTRPPRTPVPLATMNPAFDEVIPSDRRTLWHPGVTYAGGGIPDRSEICVTLSPNGSDDTAVIQDALDTCPEDQVVQLEAGTFRITGDGLFLGRSYITLRGSGTGEPGSGEGGTRLVKVDRDENQGSAVLYIGASPGSFTDVTDLAEDAVKGETSLTLKENPGLQVGEYILIDQVTNDHPAVAWNEQHEGPGGGSRRWFARQDRSLTQIVEITAVDGNRISFATPLHFSFETQFDAQIARFAEYPDGPVAPFVEWAGVEDLYVEGGMGGDYHGNIAMSNCAYCWIRNIESNLSVGTAVGFYSTYRSEVRDSYIHSSADPNPGGAGYLLGINFGASDNLVENNIIWSGNKVIVVRASGGGNVVAYNYMEDGFGDYYKEVMEIGLNAAHYTTPHMELLEGNQAFNAAGESYWGNSIYITMYRNHITGTRRSADGLGLTDEVLRKIMVLDRYSWFFNIVGNVLGEEDMKLFGEQERFIYEATADDLDGRSVAMWLIGHSGENTEIPFDQQVVDTLLRHGNFDFVTGDVVWDDAYSRELPPSLYLDEKPEFFGDQPWPWVVPEDGGATYTLPARERFDQIHGEQ